MCVCVCVCERERERGGEVKHHICVSQYRLLQALNEGFHNLLTTIDSVFTNTWLRIWEFSVTSVFMRNILPLKNMDHIMFIILVPCFLL
jgi:hypothetical protein